MLESLPGCISRCSWCRLRTKVIYATFEIHFRHLCKCNRWSDWPHRPSAPPWPCCAPLPCVRTWIYEDRICQHCWTKPIFHRPFPIVGQDSRRWWFLPVLDLQGPAWWTTEDTIDEWWGTVPAFQMPEERWTFSSSRNGEGMEHLKIRWFLW